MALPACYRLLWRTSQQRRPTPNPITTGSILANTRTRSLPKQERSRFTVDAILQAAEQLLAGHPSGKKALSTRTVARLAGVSVGTLYQYFPGRDAVIAQVVERRLAHDERALLRVFDQHRDKPLAELIRHSLEALLPKTTWELALYPEMVDRLHEVERHGDVQRFIARFETLWTRELHTRKAELRPGLSPDVAAITSIHAIRGVMLAMGRRDPPPPRPALVDQLSDLSLSYLMGDTMSSSLVTTDRPR